MSRSILPLLLAFLAPWTLAGEPEISPDALAIFEKRYAALQKTYDEAVASYATRIERSKDPDYTVKLARSLEGHHLAFLRFLITLEKDLVMMVTPTDGPDLGNVPSGISITERRRIEKLRQDIRDEERKRIAKALKDGTPLHGDERIEESLDRDEQSLDSLFKRVAAAKTREIDKARRAIGKEQISDRRDESKMKRLEKAITEAEAEVSAMHQFCYGFRPGAGFEEAPGWPADAPAEQLRAAMAEARANTLKILRDDGEGGEDRAKAGMIGGSFLYSMNLGVVLDISGSMTPFIEPLKEEIAGTFEAPRYREIANCRLRLRGSLLEADFGKAAFARETMTHIEELVVVYGVDTVYWFTDLQDEIDFAALRRLRLLLRRGGTAFHVKSVDRSPNRDLEPLIDDFQQ